MTSLMAHLMESHWYYKPELCWYQHMDINMYQRLVLMKELI